MRVAIVHDYLTHFGGAERVLAALMELFPHAPVYTIVHNPREFAGQLDESRLRTSFLQYLPGSRRPHRYFALALMPLAVERFDLRHFDVVLSASHSFGKGVITGPHTLHISYCFTPTRYAWDDSHRYVREFSPRRPWRTATSLALSYLRLWDFYAAQRVDRFVTLSDYVARRIEKYYRREAEVIPPPVNVEQFEVGEQTGNYYLVVARLVPYKRVDLAVAACEKLGRPLKIVGIGPEEKRLREKAGRWTSFLGFVPDEQLRLLYQGARALLFPQEEDFGITPLEAAACGRPTIAFAAGGALETVVAERAGVFFKQQTADCLAAAMEHSEKMMWDKQLIRRQAEKYRREVFLGRMKAVVETAWEEYNFGFEE